MLAIIGRQNVGKSTLLNRLAGKPLAIVEDLPGTTRDRIFANISWQGAEFTIVDTGGLELRPRSNLAEAVREQAEIAISDADVLLFLVDVKDGVTAIDLDIANMLRKVGKPIVLAANKADNARLEAQSFEFFELALGEPSVISAYHNHGIVELLDRIVPLLPPPSPAKGEPEAMKVAIVGRPNVGKSTLLNVLLGQPRAIVSEAPGTTRDAIETILDFHGESVLLIDVGGIRRPGRRAVGIERYSVIRAFRAIDRSDITLLVLDAGELVTAQDKHIAGYVRQDGKGIVVVVNKWDLVVEKRATEYDKRIRSQIKFMPYAPILYVSAKYGEGVNKILPQARGIYQERFKRLSAAEVNNVIKQAVADHNLPRVGTKRLKVFSATQAGFNPPSFILLVNDTRLIHFSYQRYLENKLRQSFGFFGTPLRLTFKTRGERNDNR